MTEKVQWSAQLILACGLMLTACGSRNGGDGAKDDGGGGPAASAPARDVSGEPDALDTLSGAISDAPTKAGDAVSAAADDVTTWFSGLDVKLDECRTKVETYKAKFSRTVDDDIRSLIVRAEENIAEIEKSLDGFLTLSAEQAEARRVQIEQFFAEIDAIFKDIDKIRATRPGQ